MKQVISFILTFTIFSSMLLATGNPTKKVIILENESITIKTNTESDASLFTEAFYNKKDKSLEFNTEVEITFVQIFSTDGQLEFQLPTMSKNVKIGMSFFDKGDYKLGFIVKGKENIQFTEVNIR